MPDSIIQQREQLVRDYLARAGMTDPKQVESHLKGWDLSEPVYERSFEPGERLVQHISNPHRDSRSPVPETGHYYGLPGGQTLGEMGIGSGVNGRTANEFEIVRPFTALEGTAKAIDERTANESYLSLGGSGGATQIFIPDCGLSCLRPAHAIDCVAEQSANALSEEKSARMSMEYDRRNQPTNERAAIASDTGGKDNEKKSNSLADNNMPDADRNAAFREQAIKELQERQPQRGQERDLGRSR